MRIISGSHKGKRLIAPKNLPVRPTTDFAKEGLFNILRNRVGFNEISVLDLFSGTGNIAYEFASRGTERISCVDGHYGCVKYIQQTAKQLEFPIRAIKADVFSYLSHEGNGYDLIFADPPYDITPEELQKLVAMVFENNWLNEGGTLIVEHSKHLDTQTWDYFTEHRKYGGSVFSFFEKE